MKSKRTIFPPIISVIYIVTVLAFVISMVVEYKSSPARIQARIDELVRATTQNLSVNQANSEEFQSAFLVSPIHHQILSYIPPHHIQLSLPLYRTLLANRDGIYSDRTDFGV